MSEVFEFRWRVSASGYEWLNTREFGNRAEARFLTDGAVWGSLHEYWEYDPLLDSTGLFRTFAATPPTEKGIQGFAKKYGYLHGPVMIRLPRHGAHGGATLGRGERLSFWVHQIHTMRRAVHLWDLAQEGRVDELNRHVFYDPPGEPGRAAEGWRYESHPGHESREIPPGFVAEFVERSRIPFVQPYEVARVATFLVQGWINKGLKDRVSPHVLYDLERRKQVLRIVPASLLGAMWLQFAQAIDGNKNYRACRECGQWFEISPAEGAFRTNRVFCSDACKSRDYRKRTRRVRSSGAGKAAKNRQANEN